MPSLDVEAGVGDVSNLFSDFQPPKHQLPGMPQPA